ncbi:Nif3-like dinuclear metal center hexameric protein [Endozoicomonadaceae bacterium StTr2]
MAISLSELIQKLDTTLESDRYRDYCPNGLQVEGKSEIKRLVTGVTACQSLIDAAVEQQADAILVHHGFFWKGEDAAIAGMKRRRIQKLLQHDISLIAYHLPLDAHQTMGNNARLGDILGWKITGPLEPQNRQNIGFEGELDKPVSLAEFGKQIASGLNREPLLIAGGEHPVKRIAWCTGGAQDYIDHALALGVDAFISGEISERTVHTARECGIHYIAAGHHATERYGVQAVGDWLAVESGIEHLFIDIDNPV